jgi:hypothetical protein
MVIAAPREVVKPAPYCADCQMPASFRTVVSQAASRCVYTNVRIGVNEVAFRSRLIIIAPGSSLSPNRDG